MFYKKNGCPKLDTELFKKPTSEYRGAPFWSWNCELDRDTLIEQVEYLKQMGFGGFHMHTRSGMATEYLSEEYMELIELCVEKARAENLLAWLYDEDRWPSGAAGGIVTKNKHLRQKYIYISDRKSENAASNVKDIADGLPYLFACYDICFNENGELLTYKIIDQSESVHGEKWYAYIRTVDESGWFNNQTYPDTLSKEAIDRFIEVTHEAYKSKVGKDFGGLIPAIFTDEPAFYKMNTFKYSKGCHYADMPWTVGIEEGYEKKYGINLKASLPELFWDLPDHKPSRARYCFHDYVCELFASSFMDNIANWCRSNNFSLTGHIMAEESLSSQSYHVGEAMRCYRSMGIPGMDMLCNGVELSTAKQVQSVVHQYGKEAMLSELYGVTNWDFDFRGHKFQGDWQAALGVTVRVPHLSWVSMKGSAKRDYPATFNYQIPWFKEYTYIEDHFARLNTALTRGKPVVTVGVIHPVESEWLYTGPADASSDMRRQLQENFNNIINWLLFGLIDFDFISEALLSDIGSVECGKLKAGQMQYSSIVVPGCITMRRSTLELLKDFRNNGGQLIFFGGYPKYIDAVESDEGKALCDIADNAPMNRFELLCALKNERFLEIQTETSENHERLIHSLRQDGDVYWLFIAHGKQDTYNRPFYLKNSDVPISEKVRIFIKGEFVPILFDTITGETRPLECYYENNRTVIPFEMFEHDSLLIQLSQGRSEYQCRVSKRENIKTIHFRKAVDYTIDEPNVYILDMAEYKLDDSTFQPLEEILRIDEKCRQTLGFPMADGCDTQPWVLAKQDDISHFVTLRYCIESDIELANVMLAAEEISQIYLNGYSVSCDPIGYYVDKSIKTYSLPSLNKGNNELLVKVPIGKRISVECMYLLGDFGVKSNGADKKIIKKCDRVNFADIVNQGFPFFGGNITYCTEFEADTDCSAEITVGKYRGALVKVMLDGRDIGKIVFEPYKLTVSDLSKGKHRLEFVLYGNRVNTFGSLHNYSGDTWYGPSHWYAKDEKGFCYEYCLKENGILISPTVKLFKVK